MSNTYFFRYRLTQTSTICMIQAIYIFILNYIHCYKLYKVLYAEDVYRKYRYNHNSILVSALLDLINQIKMKHWNLWKWYLIGIDKSYHLKMVLWLLYPYFHLICLTHVRAIWLQRLPWAMPIRSPEITRQIHDNEQNSLQMLTFTENVYDKWWTMSRCWI